MRIFKGNALAYVSLLLSCASFWSSLEPFLLAKQKTIQQSLPIEIEVGTPPTIPKQENDKPLKDSKNEELEKSENITPNGFYQQFVRRRVPEGYLRVAVVVAGTLQRFMFNSTLEHMIKPFGDGRLDYYVSLTAAQGKAFRSDIGYTNHFQPDPILPKPNLSDFANVEEFIRAEVTARGATIGAVKIQESIDIDSEPMLQRRREQAQKDHPEEDPDLRFPMFDLRPEAAKQTASGNRKLLRFHRAVQDLWSTALKWELEEGFQYDYVIFLKEDSLWLNDFDLHKLSKNEGDIYVPSCDARDPPMSPLEMNDQILIARRTAADLYGNYYSTLQNTDTTQCMNGMPEILTKDGLRGCNSEMLLNWMVHENQFSVSKVTQGDIPFQRSANVELSDGSNLQCFNTYCQSKDNPMTFLGKAEKMQKCKDIDWNQYFPSTGR